MYSQAFSTISSVIPAFCKRGDIIVADRGVNFAIQKGLQISRCTVRWYDHNSMESLQHVLESVEKERRKKNWPLTRRFIVTEGIFDHDGAMSDLPKLVELKQKYKYRLILDESVSFGSVGRTGRGLTELYNVPVCTSVLCPFAQRSRRGTGISSGHAHRVSRQRSQCHRWFLCRVRHSGEAPGMYTSDILVLALNVCSVSMGRHSSSLQLCHL